MKAHITGERAGHCRRHVAIAQEVARGNTVSLRSHPMGPQHLGAAVASRLTVAVDDRHLPVVRIFVGGDDLGQRLGRRTALCHQIECPRANRRIGHILGCNSASAGPRPGATAGNTDAGGGDGDPEHAGARAAPDEREGHGRALRKCRALRGAGALLRFLLRSSGMTAQASISITHSGRARPWTIRPVETGNTPFSHFPTTR